MAFETKKDRSGDENDVWEALLTRRLANELDAFLEETDDETFLFAEETNAARRTNETSGKRPRFKTLATVAASAAILCGAASTVRVYLTSPQRENVAELRQVDDEPSLLAWSVENLSEAQWTRHVEAKWESADFFELDADLGTDDKASEEARFDGRENAFAEESETAEDDTNEWFNVEKLADVASWRPLKYEPFLQAVAASLP